MYFFSLDSPANTLRAATELGGTAPLTRLFFLARANGALTAAVEPALDCAEWNEEYGLFYGGIGAHLISGAAFRAHLTKAAPTNDAEFVAAGESKCVGHVVVRPSPLASVAEADVPPAHRSAHHFLTCVDQEIGAASFMQQDGVVSRCAQAAIWMATRALSARYPDCVAVGSKAIHDSLSDSDWGAPLLPSGGLHQAQIRHALMSNGYRTLTYDFETQRDERGEVPYGDHIVYRYVESGFPVILGIQTEGQRHALVVVGHSFDGDAWWPRARAGYYPTLAGGESWLPSALWANDYICHDDNFGPYLNLSRGSIRARTTEVSVAIPSNIGLMMTPEDAEVAAAGFLFSTIFEAIPGSPGRAYDPSPSTIASAVRSWAAERQMVLRTILVSQTELLVHLVGCDYGADVIAKLTESAKLRPWIWLVEVSSSVLFGEQLKFGEVLLDPSAPPLLPERMAPLLALHLPGYLLHRDATRAFAFDYPTNDAPGSVFKRPMPVT